MNFKKTNVESSQSSDSSCHLWWALDMPHRSQPQELPLACSRRVLTLSDSEGKSSHSKTNRTADSPILGDPSRQNWPWSPSISRNVPPLQTALPTLRGEAAS